jgi:hypothetical protein
MAARYTKQYYIQLSTSGNGSIDSSSSLGSLFNNVALNLIDAYNSGNTNLFQNTFQQLQQLKVQNPDYILTSELNIYIQTIDIINALVNVNSDLLQQITSLEQITYNNCHKNIGLEVYNIQQDTQIDLVYVQYLLMFDLNLTNGLFIDSYLEQARITLEQNEGKLKHFY